jgi:hypothetical protein
LTTAKFKYEPLDVSGAGQSNAIRILELLPGQDDDPLSCNLRHTTLATAPEYETLSYRWGDTTDREFVSCNGSQLSIPRALATALRNIRFRDCPRLIWADAACIDQSNLREKEQQVQLMRVIYSQSQRTLIWLGDQPPLRLSWAVKVPTLFSLRWFWRRVKDQDIPRLRVTDFHTGEQRLVSPLESEGYLLYMNVLRNPWFKRAWVVQEVAVSSNPTILTHGGSEIPWSDAVTGLEFLSSMNFGLAFMPSLQHVSAIEHERRRYVDGGGRLAGVLQRHWRCEATDRRDKIFAFLGLVGEGKDAVKISYSKPVEDVYREVAMTILSAEDSLGILSQPATLQVREGKLLPSWVPDWSHVRAVRGSHAWGLEALSLAKKVPHSDDKVQLAFAAAPALTRPPSFTNNGHGLRVQGHILDTITEVGDIFKGIELPPPVTNFRGLFRGWLYATRSYLGAQRALMSWEALAGARQRSVPTYACTGEPMMEAYWKVASAGDWPHIAGARVEVGIWDRVNKLSWKLRKIRAERILLLPCSMLLAVWQSLSKGPAFKFHLQGHYSLYRRLAKTEKGYLALVAAGATVGDVVMLVRGCVVPVVLRRKGNGTWRLVGDAYVHGVMFGEGWDDKAVVEMIIR